MYIHAKRNNFVINIIYIFIYVNTNQKRKENFRGDNEKKKKSRVRDHLGPKFRILQCMYTY